MPYPGKQSLPSESVRVDFDVSLISGFIHLHFLLAFNNVVVYFKIQFRLMARNMEYALIGCPVIPYWKYWQ